MARNILYPAVALVIAGNVGNTVAGGAGSWQPHNPIVFNKPFPVGEQQFSTSPAPQRFLPGFGWNGGNQFDYQFKKPVPAAQQQWSSFQPAGFIATTLPDGWRATQWDTQFKKPFPVGEQQYSGFHRPPEAITPQGWFPEPPHIFKKPFNVALQQYTPAPSPLPPPPPGFGWWGWQLDYAFAKPFPVALQQYTGYQPQGVIPPFFPPGAGKYPKLPSYIPQPPYEAKPNKPFRPVWDKPKQGVIEQPKQAPLGPPPLPPAELFGKPGQAGDAAAHAAPVLALPSFMKYVPDDPLGLDQRMRDIQDRNDALAVLKKLGLIPDNNSG